MVTTTTLREEVAPRRVKMSYEEYLEFAEDSKIMEWVNEETLIYMPPIYEHQDISRFIGELLDGFVEFFNLGRIIHAPFEVKLWPGGPAREPDIIFISRANLPRLISKRFEGGPDLLVEIISRSSVSQDRAHKFGDYQQAGVREYWIIDPRPRQQQADFYLLGSDHRYYPAPIDEAGRYHSTVLPNFWLDLEWLWRKRLLNPQLALAEVMLSIETLPPEARTAYQAMYQLLVSRK